MVHRVGPQLVVARHPRQGSPPCDPAAHVRVSARRACRRVRKAVANARASHGQNSVEAFIFFAVELGAKDAQDQLRQTLPQVARQRDPKAQALLRNVGGHAASAGRARVLVELLPHQARHPPLAARERYLLVVVFEVVRETVEVLVESLLRRCAQHGVVVHLVLDPRLDFCLLPLHACRAACHAAAVSVDLAAVVGGVKLRCFCARALEPNGLVDAHALDAVRVAGNVTRAPAVRGAPLPLRLELPRRAPLAHEARRRKGQGVVDSVVARLVQPPELLLHARYAVPQRREVRREEKRQRQLGPKVNAVA